MAEVKSTDKQNAVDLSQEGLFELQCIIKANDIHHAARSECRHRQFLAFVSGASDLGLYYLKDSSSLPVIKKIPWFQSSRKKIACLCFDPLGSWLLIASIDSSLYIVPAKTLVDEFYPTEQKWTTKDVTSFSSLNAQNSYSRPSAIAWWQGVSFAAQTGIVGTEQGEIIFVNLETGQQVGSTKVDGRVTGLCICQDTELDTVMLLITNHCKEQWHLVLEKPGSNYTYPLSNGGSQRSTVQNEETDNDDSKSFPTTRSRLRGLKQLSVEKLVILKQKLAESRNRNFDSSGVRADNSNRDNSEVGSNDNENCNKSGFFSNHQSETIKCSTTPIALPNDMYIIPQSLKNGRTIYTGYLSPLDHLTIHDRSSSVTPSHVHKVPEHCENIRLTNRFFYISDTRHRFVYIVSRTLSEIRKKEKNEFIKDSVIARFSFDKSEEVINSIYTLSSAKSDVDSTAGNNENRVYTIVKDTSDIKIKVPPVDTCIVVTNLGVYKIILRDQILSLFMDLVLKQHATKDASKLALIFGLNVQELFEIAGDVTLHKRQFSKAVELYSLAGCRLSKSILKFATIGYTTELLSLLISYSTTSAVNELSEPNRIHFSNLSVLAFTELLLRATSTLNKIVYKDFLYFLSTNIFYDELYAINIALQNNMWSVLHHLVVYRGLGPQVLDVLIKALPTLMSKNSNLLPHHNTHGLLMCLSDSNLIQGMLSNPSTARNHICFVLANLPSLQIFILQRLIALYDPTSPVIRPLVLRLKARRRAASRSSFSSQCDSLDLSEDLDEIGVLIEEIIEVFLQTLLTVLDKKQPSVKFTSKFVPFTQLCNIETDRREKNISVDFRRRLLSTGFAHTALIRNGNVYTWGNSLQGCLGTGPSISRYSSPQAITIFRRLGIDVLSVSCGRCHTLAVTNNGVYAWGGSRYGQLGFGEMRECPNPGLITALAHEIIIDAVAGQHHSVALTADGRVFTWGWGVHGQLGHGNTETKRQPCLVTALLGIMVRHVSAGYAHTVVLSSDGIVYAFGCNLFGQLGTGNDGKCTSPVRVSLLPEKITFISTKYFHNLATSCTNQLYVWGSNPQILRLQSKERKVRKQRAKMAEAQERELAAASLADTSEEQENANDTSEPNEATATAASSNAPPAAAAAKSSTVVESDEENEEENQIHLVPTCVDKSLVKGKIIQISTGYHHSALLTKDGTIYTWGRNLDGQLGTGYGRDLAIPTPLKYQPLNLFKEKLERVHSRQTQATDDKNNANNSFEANTGGTTTEPESTEKDLSYLIKAVKICCGSNFTVAIQPGGNVIAWGNNNLAQLGRAPASPKDSDEKLILKFKSSKRIIRCINHTDRLMAIDTTPSQVPNIPSPIISYQSYDLTPLAGSLQPLSYIEQSLSDLTLHYAFEQFHGLFSTFKILNKCVELKNYQACAKLELLEHNFVESLIYQFKALKECDVDQLETYNNELSIESVTEEAKQDDILQENKKLFEKHMERNLVDTLMESVKKQKMKMPVSKSLDSFQVIEQDLHTFDCQGGSEEMFDDSKYEGMSMEMALESDNKEDRSSPLSSTENSISREEVDNENSLCTNLNKMSLNNPSEARSQCANGNALSHQELLVMHHAVNIVDFYLYEVEEDAYVPTYEIAATAINFWSENKLPIEELEKVFDKNLKKIFYALGLLLFGHCDFQNSSTLEKNEKNIRVKNAGKILSTGFCLKVCNLILKQIDEGKPTVEYIEMLSTTMAKNYGPPLTGYPGTSDNKTPEQMIDGIISTLSAKYYDPRPFIHIKDPDKVSELLNAEEDSMIFTCGHQFLISTYLAEAVPRMETELLSLRSPLPSTAQLLGSILYQSYKPETLCPLCLSQVLKDAAKDVADR